MKSYTTTNSMSHLTKHPNVNTEYSERKAVKEIPPWKETHKRKIKHQLSLLEVQELSKPWDINDTRSQSVHKRIGEMLVVDCQMVEDVGFKRVLQALEPHATNVQAVSILRIQLYLRFILAWKKKCLS